MNNLQDQQAPVHPTLKIIFGLILAGFILTVLFSSFMYNSTSSIFILLGEVLLILPSFIYLKLKNYNFQEVFRLRKIDARIIYLSFPLGAAMTVLSDEIDRIVSTFIKMPPEWQEALIKSLSADTAVEWLNLFLGAVILAGIIEEMLFRGMLQKAFEQRFDLPHAIFSAALIFALIHLPFWLIQVLILGIIFGLVAWRCNSTIPTMILHCFNNALALVFANTNAETWHWYNWNGHVNPTVLVIAAGALYYSAKLFYRWTDNSDFPAHKNSI